MKVLRDDVSTQKSEQLSGDRWRCDLHPSSSRDGKLIVYNGRIEGKDRQVIVSYIGHLLLDDHEFEGGDKPSN